MRISPRLKLNGVQERTLAELVSEDGVLSTGDILAVIRQLCLLPDLSGGGGADRPGARLHPQRIIVGAGGRVRSDTAELSLTTPGRYLPPEADPAPEAVTVYALGMLMLFMATGKESKRNIEVVIADRALLTLIERCTAFDPRERFQNTVQLLEAVKKTERSRRKNLPAMLTALAVCLLSVILFFIWRSGEQRGRAVGEPAGFASGYVDGYEQGLTDAPGIPLRGPTFDTENGNLAGNLTVAGGAVTARSADSVFFLSEDKIFQMNPYTRDLRLLAADTGASDLHYYKDRLYYCTNEQVICLNPETAAAEVICDTHGGRLFIFDNVFYLYDDITTGYLYRLDPRRKQLTQLNGAMKYLCLQIVDGKLYYIASDRGNSIYSSELDGSNEVPVSSNAYESFCIYEDKLYAGTERGLVRMDLNGGNPEYLTTQPARFPNVSEVGIFYLSGTRKNLEWISFDGRMRYVVVPARTATFNVAGQWIFYCNEEDGNRLWRIRVNGADGARVED